MRSRGRGGPGRGHCDPRPDRASVPRRLSLFRICSVPLTLALFFTAGVCIAEQHALLIGLDKYQSVREISPLQYAEDDVTALEEALAIQGFEVVPLVNHRATRTEIIRELTKYALDLDEDDTFLLYFSGHGIRNALVNDRSYWLTYSADLSFLEVDGIRLSHLLDYVADIKAGKKLILLDHCFSGNLSASVADGPAPTSPGGDSGTRGPEAIMGLQKAALLGQEDFKTELSKEAGGLVILAASRGLALESSIVRHGVFTKAVLEAIAELKADADGLGQVSVSELIDYVEAKVPEMAQAHNFEQYVVPIIESGTMLGQWVLAEARGSAIPRAVAEQTVARLKAQLQTWLHQFKIDAVPYGHCKLALDRWLESYDSGVDLTDTQARLLDQIKTVMSSDSLGDDEKASTLNDVCH